jgi:hypothetical protein
MIVVPENYAQDVTVKVDVDKLALDSVTPLSLSRRFRLGKELMDDRATTRSIPADAPS